MQKKSYTSPELKTVLVSGEDILLGSDVLIDSSGLFEEDE